MCCLSYHVLHNIYIYSCDRLSFNFYLDGRHKPISCSLVVFFLLLSLCLMDCSEAALMHEASCLSSLGGFYLSFWSCIWAAVGVFFESQSGCFEYLGLGQGGNYWVLDLGQGGNYWILGLGQGGN